MTAIEIRDELISWGYNFADVRNPFALIDTCAQRLFEQRRIGRSETGRPFKFNCAQGNFDVFKKYSQMRLAMKREALDKLNRRANEMKAGATQMTSEHGNFGTVLVRSRQEGEGTDFGMRGNALE